MKLLILAFLLIAESDVSYGKIRIHKCCNTGQSVNENDYEISCIANVTDSITFTQINVYDTDAKIIGRFDDFFELEPGFFSDKNIKLFYHYGYVYTSYYLIKNGSVVMTTWEYQGVSDPDSYCLDESRVDDDLRGVVVFLMHPLNRHSSIFKFGLLISIIFLFLLLVVYVILEELRTLGGKILMAYAGSLMLAYVFYFSLQIMEMNPSASICLFITLMTYYFMLSSFCWMGVMSYDIWWTFRGYAKAWDVNRRNVCFKFSMYSLFGWGVPLALTIAFWVLNSIDKSRLPGIIKPEIPGQGCFLTEDVKGAYLFGPLLIITTLNWIFFGMTVFNIWSLRRETQILNENAAATCTKSAYNRFVVYLKLSIVMGLNWITEALSTYSKSFEGWYITDIFNTFIGLIIFLLFVCKKNVLRSLMKKLTRNRISNMSFSNSTSSRSRSTRSTLDSNSQGITLQAMNPNPGQE